MLDAAIQSVPRVRRDDPSTSFAAAEAAVSLANVHQGRILGVLAHEAKPVGATRIAELTGLTQVQVCRRLPELLEQGVIRVRGEGRTASGRPERCWELVRNGDPASGVALGAVAL